MEYMESKMQEIYDGQAEKEQVYADEFDSFCEWCLAIPDFDETLLTDGVWHSPFEFESASDTVNAMWCAWLARSGV